MAFDFEAADYVFLGLFALIIIGITYLMLPALTEEFTSFSVPSVAKVPIISSAVIQDLPGDKVAIDTKQSLCAFTGSSSDNTKSGTFTNWEGYFFVEDGKITGASGSLDATSVSTGTSALDSHLNEFDMLSTALFPDIFFTTTLIDEENGLITGELTFLGVTEAVEFPAVISKNRVTSGFDLDTSPFGIKNSAIDSSVRIKFDFVASQ